MALTPDQLNQLNTWYSSNPSSTSTLNLGGKTYQTMGVSQADEGGFRYTPNEIYRNFLNPDGGINTSLKYVVDPKTGNESLVNWNHGGNLIGGAAKDLGTIAAMFAAMYAGGQAVGGMLGAGGAGAGAGAGGAAGSLSPGAGEVISKAALDGTTAFGANSVPGAFDLASLGGVGAGAGAGGGYFSLPDIASVPELTNSVSGLSPLSVGGSSLGVGLLSSAGKSVLGGLLSGSGGGGGNGGGEGGLGGLNLDGLLGLATGAYGMDQQRSGANSIIDYLKQRQGINDNMYKPGSPEYNALWDEMSRKDAAAGRNSQYGPRSVDLAARIAQLKMDANTRLTSGIANNMAAAYNSKANAGANVTSMLPQLFSGNNGGSGFSLGDLTRWLGNGAGNISDPSTWNWAGATPGVDVGGQVGTDFWGPDGI